jgi:hypothetical protein
MAVLNSGVISFYYKKSFRSLKVLRSAIESLPIPKCSKAMQDEITQAALALSFSEIAGETKPADFNTQKEILDRKITHLYGLSENEYIQIISHNL